MERFHGTRATLAVALTAALLAAPAAFAQAQPAAAPQNSPQANPAASQSGTGPTPSHAELKHFAVADVEVENIRKALQPKLAAAQTANQRTQLKQAAEKQMEAVVRSHQLSLHRYVQIAHLVQTNSTIRSEVEKLEPPAPARQGSKS